MRSLAARLQRNLGHLEHGRTPEAGGRGEAAWWCAASPQPRGWRRCGSWCEARRGGEGAWRSAGLYIYTLSPASSARGTSCCGASSARTARTVSTASTPALPSPAGHGHADRGPDHAELVAGLCGLHVAAGVILRLAASAQLLALVKKVNLILARRAALRRMK